MRSTTGTVKDSHAQISCPLPQWYSRKGRKCQASVPESFISRPFRFYPNRNRCVVPPPLSSLCSVTSASFSSFCQPGLFCLYCVHNAQKHGAVSVTKRNGQPSIARGCCRVELLTCGPCTTKLEYYDAYHTSVHVVIKAWTIHRS